MLEMKCQKCEQYHSEATALCRECRSKTSAKPAQEVKPQKKPQRNSSMALVICKDCKHEISKKATSCPNCGAPQKPKTSTTASGCLTLIILVVFIGFISSMCDDGSPQKPEKTATQIAKESAECKKDIQCWGDKNSISATIYCDDYVEKLAKYSYEWTDGMLESKFSRFRWKNIAEGQITYIGDKIKFQNGFGAFQNYIYECDFDPERDIVLDVRARPGQLP